MVAATRAAAERSIEKHGAGSRCRGVKVKVTVGLNIPASQLTKAVVPLEKTPKLRGLMPIRSHVLFELALASRGALERGTSNMGGHKGPCCTEHSEPSYS